MKAPLPLSSTPGGALARPRRLLTLGQATTIGLIGAGGIASYRSYRRYKNLRKKQLASSKKRK
jgi:hypothetical protein